MLDRLAQRYGGKPSSYIPTLTPWAALCADEICLVMGIDADNKQWKEANPDSDEDGDTVPNAKSNTVDGGGDKFSVSGKIGQPTDEAGFKKWLELAGPQAWNPTRAEVTEPTGAGEKKLLKKRKQVDA